jgi:hypothetical protein
MVHYLVLPLLIVVILGMEVRIMVRKATPNNKRIARHIPPRHGTARPGHLCQRAAATGGPDEPCHDDRGTMPT